MVHQVPTFLRKVGYMGVEKAEASQFLILHPFPVKKVIVLKLQHKVDMFQEKFSYFEIDKIN